MKKFLSFCVLSVLLCLWSRAQFSFNDLAFIGQVAPTVSSGPAPFMTNLAYAWEFISLPTNVVAPSWTDRVQQVIISNGASARQPSNNALGLQFNNNRNLTSNVPISLGGTNYTINVFVRALIPGNGGFNINDSLIGTNNLSANTKFGFGLQYGGSSTLLAPADTRDTGAGANFGSTVVTPMTACWDFVYSVSNNANGGGGAVYCWTNGILAAAIGNANLNNSMISFIGAGPIGLVDIGGIGQSNLIQGVYIQTNYASTLANVSNVHYYRTNILTPGASP